MRGFELRGDAVHRAASRSIPPGSSTLQAPGFAQAKWPTLQWSRAGTRPDRLRRRDVALSYGRLGQDGPADNTSTTSSWDDDHDDHDD